MRAGRARVAAGAFREAATLDTSFALAQYRLAMSATWVAVSGATDSRTIALMAAAAARHAEHLTPLVRDLLSAYTAYKEVRADEAERAYRRITASHSENVEAWFMLGETWFHYNPLRGRSPQQARQLSTGCWHSTHPTRTPSCTSRGWPPPTAETAIWTR